MPRPILATISLPALHHNLAATRRQLGSSDSRRPAPRVWAVIKANAYGHDIANALPAFADADGLAMLDLDEAVRCREAGWAGPILLLEGFFEAGDIPVLAAYRLTTVLHCSDQLQMLEAARTPQTLDALVKINTGMNRLGFAPPAYGAAYRRAQALQAAGKLGTLGKMTHFACADDRPVETRDQLDAFARATRGLPGPVSVCNSAAAWTPGLWSSVDDPGEQWVRPGICLYGASPFADRSAAALGLQPAMTLSSQLISVRDIAKGEHVGYGYTFTASGPMRLGVVACGYADGYPRHAPSGTPISVAGRPTQVVGRVSMDMLVADISHISEARVGSPVVVWGDGGPSVDDVAAAAGTIGYELLCAVAPRVPRARVPLRAGVDAPAPDESVSIR